mgnify:CR=1 FL=1
MKIRKLAYKFWMNYKRRKFIKEQKKKGTIISKKSSGYINVVFEGKNKVPDLCSFTGNISIGYASTLGVNNYFSGVVEIGKYCQIGVDVAFHATNHPIHHITTYINVTLLNGELKKFKKLNKVTIGNDVWIGHGVIVLPGVTIGDGAIVGAGSIVTRNVAPYSIVAGSPARKIKKRFNDKIIEELQELKWWDKSENEIEKLKPLFLINFEGKESLYN